MPLRRTPTPPIRSKSSVLESILPHIAGWGLVFALLNLFITVEKHLSDSGKAAYSKMVVIIIATILSGYAAAIGVMVVNALFSGAEMTPPA